MTTQEQKNKLLAEAWENYKNAINLACKEYENVKQLMSEILEEMKWQQRKNPLRKRKKM